MDPPEPELKAPGFNLLTLKYDEPLSISAFNFNSRHYITVSSVNDPPAIHAPDAMQIYGARTRLTGLSISDVDAGDSILDVTIYAGYGLMATTSGLDAEQGSRTIALRGRGLHSFAL